MQSISFSADGKYIVTAGWWAACLKIFDLETKELVLQLDKVYQKQVLSLS